MTKDTVVLQLEPHSLVFRLLDGAETGKTVNIDRSRIAGTMFRHEIPTEGEVEEAINYIEDELMAQLDLVRAGETLLSADDLLAEILGLGSFSRQEVEELFTRYALRSMGRSAAYDDLPITRQAYATLLVLREIMHHYDYNTVQVQEGRKA